MFNVIIAFVAGSASLVLFALHRRYGLRFRCASLFRDFPKELKLSSSSSLSSSKWFNKGCILCQNTWCIFPKGGGQMRLRLQILLDGIKHQQPQPHFVCLQEMHIWSLFGIFMLCGNVLFVQDQMAKMGYFCCNDPKDSLPSWFGMNSGLLMFSKSVPISGKSSVSVDYASNQYLKFPKSVINKGFIHSMFRLNDTETLLVINTHFENVVKECKIGSIQELTDHLRNDVDGYEDCTYKILMGDFNICSNGTWESTNDEGQWMYSMLSNELDTKCGLSHDLFHGVQRTYRITDNDPNAAYDHMFVNERLKQKLVKTEVKDWKRGDLVMSDHFGLVAYFEFVQRWN